jgi:hypothetical protein
MAIDDSAKVVKGSLTGTSIAVLIINLTLSGILNMFLQLINTL